jgi:hypothetical protein
VREWGRRQLSCRNLSCRREFRQRLGSRRKLCGACNRPTHPSNQVASALLLFGRRTDVLFGRRTDVLFGRRTDVLFVGEPTRQCYFFLAAAVFAAGLAVVVALAFGERLAVALVVGCAAGLAWAVAPVFFGDCFAVVFVAAAVVVAARFFGERVAVVLGAAVFVAACLVAILLAPDVGRLVP